MASNTNYRVVDNFAVCSRWDDVRTYLTSEESITQLIVAILRESFYTTPMPVSEHLLAPDYWDGHSFNDFCRGDTVNYLPASQEEKARRKQREQDEQIRVKFALDVLNQVNYPHLETQTEISEGMFDGSQFPAGSVVRVHREKLWRNKKFEFRKMMGALFVGRIEASDWDEPTYHASTHIGVLTDSEYFPEFQKRRLVTFMEGMWRGGFSKWGFDGTSRLYLKNVEHLRTTDTWFGTNDMESLQRSTRIDIQRT